MLCAGLLTALPNLAAGQVSRITAPVDDSVRVTLRGNVSGAARLEFDLGEADQSAQMPHIRLVLSRSAEQESALEQYMIEQQNPSSPNYHKWLTPNQLGTLYGPSDADVAAITGWLQSHGLTVNTVPKSRIAVDFSGSVAQVESAFGVSIHSFNRNGEKYLANVDNPQIPAALASVVIGVAHLSTLSPKPLTVPSGRQGTLDKSTHKIVSSSAQSPGLTANLGGYDYLFITPSDAATIYDTPNPLLNANYTSASGPTYDGTGVKIGIGGTAVPDLDLITAYREIFVGDSKQPVIVNDFDAPTSSPDTEAELDLEVSGGLAPGASIYYYPSPDLFSGVQQAAEDNLVDVFSLSYLGCEEDFDTSDNLALSNQWQQFAAQGITALVAAGDAGSAVCDPAGAAEATQGLAVNGIASTAYDVAVGGTDFYGLTQNFLEYVSTTNNTYYGSALGYIPESAWNDSTWPNGALADNVPLGYGVIGDSGGASNCAFNETNYNTDTAGPCIAGWPKPYWQNAPGVPHDRVRDLPDVSLMAGNGLYGAFWAICDDADTCSDGYVGAVGGTSAAAPAFAGILAGVVQKTGGRLGLATRTLYQLARNPKTAGVFHDVTIGNNSEPCEEGSPNCVLNSAGYYFLTGYNTTAGYDLATGLGSVDAARLIKAWQDADTGTATATVTVKPFTAIVTDNQSLVVFASVTGAGKFPPTGTVTLTLPYYGSLPVPILDGFGATGTAEFFLPSSALQNIVYGNGTGVQKITVSYSGDEHYAPSTGTSSVTINAPVTNSASSTQSSATPIRR